MIDRRTPTEPGAAVQAPVSESAQRVRAARSGGHAENSHDVENGQEHVNARRGSRSAKAKRRAAEQRGRQAEDGVALALAAKGFEILARRLRTGAGELDLVAANQQTLVFIEVKARRSRMEAAYSIASRQQTRLLEGAELALALNPAWQRPDTRFDVALVYPSGIETIEDAIRYH